MNKRKVLMACMNYWSSPFQVGSNHLARHFAHDGWEIAWISDPVTPLHLLGGRIQDLNDRYTIYSQNGEYDLEGSLWNYVPGGLISPQNKPILRTSFVHENWHRLTFPNVVETVARKGFGVIDLLFLQSSSQDFWFDKIKFQKSVLRIADKNSGLSRYSKKMASIEQELAQKVDLVIYTAKTLEEYVNKLNPKNSLFLQNGVDFIHFNRSKQEIRPPPEYSRIPQPIIVYVGSFEKWWFDFELVYSVAETLKEVSFVLIGPDYLSMAKNYFTSLANVYLLGSRNYDVLPAYLIFADIGIIPFPVNKYPELIHFANPVKLYDYLASGLPVVAVATKELEQIGSPIVLAYTLNDFVNALREVLQSSINKDVLKNYARQQDWSYRYQLLLNHLNW